MNFIEKLLTGLKNIGDFIGELFSDLFSFLGQVLGYVLEFFVGIFYFIGQLFMVVVEVIQIFVALFQFFFALVTGLFRTIGSWVGFKPSVVYNMPSSMDDGWNATLDQIAPTGLLTTIPLVCIAILWIYFVVKVINLIGNKGSVKE